jgi:hypothetical protein
MTHTNENTSYSERCKKAALAYEMFVLIAPERSEWEIQITVADTYNVTKEDMMISYTETPEADTEISVEVIAVQYDLGVERCTELVQEWSAYSADLRIETLHDYIKMILKIEKNADLHGLSVDVYMQLCEDWEHLKDDGVTNDTLEEFIFYNNQ